MPNPRGVRPRVGSCSTSVSFPDAASIANTAIVS
jgi:hypothetical protein